MASFINWFIDSMASEDVIDLYFIMTDMVDINLTEDDLCETAYYDAMASATDGAEGDNSSGIPIGKRVY